MKHRSNTLAGAGRLLLVAATFALLATPSPSLAQLPEYTLPPQFVLDVVAAGLSQPTAIEFLPDGSLLFTEQAGFVKRIAPGTTETSVVLDISSDVNGLFERGLTGLALDRDFAQNGYVYLLYTYDKPGEQPDGDGLRTGRLSRYTLRNNIIDPASQKVILDGFESDVPYHSAGTVRVTSDGTLYASFGDSSNPYVISDLSLRSQDLNQLQGKIVHIHADGSAVESNPFYDPANPNSVKSRVLTYGYRNPFRFRIQPKTGVLYVGNVGWGTTESLVRNVPGGNFGWPCFESTRPTPEFKPKPICAPVSIDQLMKSDYDYPHGGDAASITAGDFAPETFPQDMRGNFFFGDYSQKWLKRAVLDADGKVSRVEDFARGIGFPVDLVFGPDGALYLADYLNGLIKRIAYAPGKHVPAARLRAVTTASAKGPANQPIAGDAPLNVTFDASASSDVDNEPLTYVWDFDASANAIATNASQLLSTQQPTVTHRYDAPGDYLARVTVLDASGWTSSAEQAITVRATKPVPRILSPGDGSTMLPGQTVAFSGQAMGLDGELLPASALKWTATVYDGWWGRTVVASGNGERFSFVMPSAARSNAPEQLDEQTSVVVSLEARDSAGRVGTNRITLYPQPRDGYLRTWWLIGGFPQDNLFSDKLPGGEAKFVLPADGAGARLIYHASRKIDLSAYIQPAQNTMAYAFIWLNSPSERDALLGMTSDDGIAVWLNGQEVWRNAQDRFVPDDTRDLDLPKVRLNAGNNTLLVKVDQKLGEWAFKLRVLNLNGSVMRDVTELTADR